MLTVEGLGVTQDEIELEARRQLAAAIASGDPKAYAEKALGKLFTGGATAGCTAAAGPAVGALCGLAANKIWSWLNSPSCGERGGVRWVVKAATGAECPTAWWHPWSCVQKWTSIISVRPAMTVEEWRAKGWKINVPGMVDGGIHSADVSPTNPVAIQIYCQLPGLPAPQFNPLLPGRIAFHDIAPTSAIAVTYYPTGSVTTRTPTSWRVAVPVGLSGAGTHIEVAPTTKRPMLDVNTPVPEVTQSEFDKRTSKPWYKKWYWWAALGGAAATGTALYIKKRRG